MSGIGLDALLEVLVGGFPSPLEHPLPAITGVDGSAHPPITTDPDGPLAAEVVLIRDIKNLLDFHSVATHLLRYEFQNEKEFIFRRTDRIRFRFDEKVAWTVDGEYGGEYNEVEVRMHQQALEIIVPN